MAAQQEQEIPTLMSFPEMIAFWRQQDPNAPAGKCGIPTMCPLAQIHEKRDADTGHKWTFYWDNALYDNGGERPNLANYGPVILDGGPNEIYQRFIYRVDHLKKKEVTYAEVIEIAEEIAEEYGIDLTPAQEEQK